MRDLEKASGTNRETIRYYIREGLLPEPERTARNAATYTQDHLARLIAIRRLKDDRFLPLSVIRTLFAGDNAGDWLQPDMLPEVEHLLRARLDVQEERVTLEALLSVDGADPDQLADAVAAGIIEVAPDGSISPRDARILRLMIDLNRLGFNRERGYVSDGLSELVGMMRAMAERDIREFFDRVAPHVGDLEAADMAERGIGIRNQLMGELFTRELLALLSERRRIANDNVRAASEAAGKGHDRT